MNKTSLKIESLFKSFGGVNATNDCSLTVNKGDIHAIIGPNGAGKTTLIAQISGLLRPDRGRILFEGHDITRYSAARRSRLGLARVFQISSIFPEFTVLENMLVALQLRNGGGFEFWQPIRKNNDLREMGMEILDLVGLTSRALTLAGYLAHGEQRRLELAMALAGQPKLLLLDEPMAGMGPEDSEKITALLMKLREKFTMLLVEHDMTAVFRLSSLVTVMVNGHPIASGTPQEIRANQEVKKAYLGDEEVHI